MLSVPNARFKFVGSVAGLRAREKFSRDHLFVAKIESQKQNKTLENNLAFDWQKTDAAA